TLDYLSQLNQSNANNDNASATVTILPPQPDLFISGAPTVNPASVAAGNSVTVSYRIKNQGSGNAGQSTTLIEIPSLGISQTFNEASVLAGGFSDVGHSLPIPSTAFPGTYTVAITLDYNRQLNQSNENNDTASTTLTILTP